MALVASIQDQLRHRYPMLEAQAMMSVEVPGDLSSPPKAVAAGRSWRITDHEGAWVVVLSADFIALTTTSYRHWIDFSQRLEEVTAALMGALRIGRVGRLGLRYTNHVPLAEEVASWPDTIDSELLGWMQSPGNDVVVDTSTQEVQLRVAGSRVGFRHGPFVKDGTRSYLLDTDVYREDVSEASPNTIVHLATSFNDVANRFFFNALTEDGLAQLNPAPKEAT